MKNVSIIVIIVSILVSFSAVVSAQTTQSAVPVTYTAQQQSCIKAAQDKMVAAKKTAQDKLNSVSKDANAVRVNAMKAAADILNASTKDALKTRMAAIAAAQKIQDLDARSTAIKAANDVYNNNAEVKKAKIPFITAIKAASDEYTGNIIVTKAKPAYDLAIKSANDQFQKDQKTCVEGKKGFFSKIGNGISNFFSKLINFFTGKK